MSAAKEDGASVGKRIRKSMLHWESMDLAGRLVGRGLGKKELIGRVARDVGASRSEVLSALKIKE